MTWQSETKDGNKFEILKTIPGQHWCFIGIVCHGLTWEATSWNNRGHSSETTNRWDLLEPKAERWIIVGPDSEGRVAYTSAGQALRVVKQLVKGHYIIKLTEG